MIMRCAVIEAVLGTWTKIKITINGKDDDRCQYLYIVLVDGTRVEGFELAVQYSMVAADVDSDLEGFHTGFNQSDHLSALFETSSMVASSARYGFRIVSYLSATRTCLVPPPVCQIVRLARETGHRSHARAYSHPPTRAASQKHPYASEQDGQTRW